MLAASPTLESLYTFYATLASYVATPGTHFLMHGGIVALVAVGCVWMGGQARVGVSSH